MGASAGIGPCRILLWSGLVVSARRTPADDRYSRLNRAPQVSRLRALGAVGRWTLAQLRLPGHQREVDRGLKVVELGLHPPHRRADVGRDLVPEVGDAEHAAYEHAEESA